MREPLISLKRYLYSDTQPGSPARDLPGGCDHLLSAYRSCLAEIADSGAQACPALASDLEKGLARVREDLDSAGGVDGISAIETRVRELLRDWGSKAAQHHAQKTGEVRDLLIVIARTAESLGQKDDRCAQQLDAVTAQLESVATLDDISRMRASIEQSARELKSSVARIAAESKTIVDHLRAEVCTYRSKLEQAEYIASRDALTGVGSRRWIEERLRERVNSGTPFSILLVDIHGFSRINEEYGNLVGDQLLKAFAKELRSSCRFSDLVARWGGDEFIVVMDCAGAEARAQVARLHSWICGPYPVGGRKGHTHVRLDASLGSAEYHSGEDLEHLLETADADLCASRELMRSQMTA